MKLSQQEGATLFMTLLAAFDVVLGRYAGQTDVVVGTDVANRTRQETEGLIGFFVNQLVLRTDLRRSETFRDLLHQVRERTLGAYAHQDLPFEKLVEELSPERDLGRAPLFQVKLVLQNAPQQRLELSGLELSVEETESQTAKFDLSLITWETAQGIGGQMEYATDLFERSTVERLVRHFQTVLEQLAEEPERKLSEVSLVSGWERKQLLCEWNRTEAVYREGCVHELFEAQAEQRPEAVALVYEAECLSYGELNARANQLGRYLRELGVGPEVRVGLCVERGLAMVVGMLGVLKAGGAYVPLDPAYPVERLAFMLEDIQAPVVLTQQHLRQQLPKSESRLLCLDTEWEEIGRRDRSNLEPVVSGKNLAYVIYTSGSTGRPKGVCVQHDHIVRLFAAARELFEFREDDSWSFCHSYAFDFSVWELWGGLLHGGRVVVVPYYVTRTPRELRALLEEKGVSVFSQTPSAFRSFTADLRANGLATPTSVRYVVFGGEALTEEGLDYWWGSPARLINMYGITETTVHVTFKEVVFGERDSTRCIGRALGDLRVYVLDECGQLCPVGVWGELYVGGAGVSRGYLNRPGLTAERFVPDGYEGGGGRLYRTGDRVRWNERGELEYQGRLDEQVKVRGYRIEPGEIEAVLQEYPGVMQSAVIAREDTAGDKRLVGYVVWSEGEPAGGVRELRSHVQSRLPEYMVPSAFVSLESLPLTGNGKLDRKALPAPEGVERSLASSYVAPADAVEEILAGVWEQVLGVERVGVEDNFFELGGHSLLATQVVSRIRDLLQVELPLRVLFESPTIRAVAAEVELIRANTYAAMPLPLVPAARNGDSLPLSYAQQRLWFLIKWEAEQCGIQPPWGIAFEW